MMLKPSAAPCLEPQLDRVGDLLRACRPTVRWPRAVGERQIELAKREAARRQVGDQLQPALVELGMGRQRRRPVVQRIARQVDARHNTA